MRPKHWAMVAQDLSGGVCVHGVGVNMQVCTPDGIPCKVRMQCHIGGGEETWPAQKKRKLNLHSNSETNDDRWVKGGQIMSKLRCLGWKLFSTALYNLFMQPKNFRPKICIWTDTYKQQDKCHRRHVHMIKLGASLTVHWALTEGFRRADPALRSHLHSLALLTWLLVLALSLNLSLSVTFVLGHSSWQRLLSAQDPIASRPHQLLPDAQHPGSAAGARAFLPGRGQLGSSP